ncbi:MAG: signal peptidase I [Tepidiformaceae bacterium]
MEQDRGLRPDGSRPSDSPLGDVDDDTWYFETSDERWALQEAKNKALKEAIRRNMSSNEEAPAPKKDPFGATVKPEPRRDAGKNEGLTPPAPDQSPNREGWSTEPWALAPRANTPVSEIPAADDGTPRSRWDEMFSAKAGDDNIDAMRKWMESSQAAKAEEAGGDLDDEVEAKLRALEMAAGSDEVQVAEDDPRATTGEPVVPLGSEIERKLRAVELGDDDDRPTDTRPTWGTPAGMDEADTLDPEIERKLRALETVGAEAGPATRATPGFDDSEPLDLEIERKLRALEANADEADEPALAEPLAWAPPGMDVSAPLDLDIERKLRALETGSDDDDTAGDGAWAPESADEDPYADEFERMLAANAFAEPATSAPAGDLVEQPENDDAAIPDPWGDAVPPSDAVAEPGTAAFLGTLAGQHDNDNDDAAVRDYWSDSFRSDEPVVEAEPAGAPEPEQSAATADEGNADGWAPEPITFDDWFRSGVAGTAPTNERAADVDTSPVAQWEPDAPGASSRGDAFAPDAESESEAEGWDPEGTDEPVEEQRPSGPLAAAAAWIATPTSETEAPNEDDPWAMMHSVASVPADANPNWPFPEPVAEPKAETPAAFNARPDDPWAVSPVDELEASLKADADAAEAPRTASTWPAQADPRASGTAWPAQADRPAEADAAHSAALYGDAGVIETLDEILNDEPAEPEAPDSILSPAEHSWGGAHRAPASVETAAPEPPHAYLQRPIEREEPKPAEGAVLLDPMRLVSEEALLADDDLGITEEDDDAVALPAPSTLSDPGGIRPAPTEPSWLNDEPIPEPQDRGHGRAKTLIREIVETGMLALLVFLAVRASFQNFRVEGDSMFPTLHDGEFLIVNKLVYSEIDMEGVSQLVPIVDAKEGETKHVFHGPERGDIVVFRDPRNPNDDLIKRVIGLPGETIEIRDGRVYVNDLLLDEPYITEEWQDKDHAKILLPENEYYVMGDNRNNSLDSRYPTIGLVREELIIGKALVSYWPRSQFGLAANATPKCHGSPDCTPIEGEDEKKIAADAAD